MPSDLTDGDPSLDVEIEACSHEVLDLWPESDLGLRHPPSGCCGRVGERALASDEDREEDAEGPYFGAWCVVGLAPKDLSRCERRCPVES